MATEAREALGPDYAQLLRAGAAKVDREPGRRAFTAFAELCEAHAGQAGTGA